MPDFLRPLRALQAALQKEKMAAFKRRVPFGDLLTDRHDNALEYGFGEGTTCYDSVLIFGDVKVGRHVWIGPNVILDGGGGGLTIGDYCSISAGVQIYTHNTVAWSVSLGRAARAQGATTIGHGVYVGPNCVISLGVTIGDGAVIGAMSLVNRDIPAGMKAWGRPARVIGPVEPPAPNTP